jgi:hypothetical protein
MFRSSRFSTFRLYKVQVLELQDRKTRESSSESLPGRGSTCRRGKLARLIREMTFFDAEYFLTCSAILSIQPFAWLS